QQEKSDPLELLRQCEEALGEGPPRLHRNFTSIGDGANGPGGRMRVMQWNILAQAALGEGLDSFVRCPPEALSWSRRKYLILEEILGHRPHILCLQEVDHYHDTLQPVLAGLGYGSSFCPKPWSPCLQVEGNNGPDGCALFFDHKRYDFLDSVNIRLSAMKIPTNQVAVATVLRCRSTGKRVCVAVTHLKARSGWERLRGQGADLLRHIHALVQKHGLPLLICGDFNAAPTEEVYRRFSASVRLDSAYKKLSRGGLTEPEYTTWKIRPSGESCSTLDYIWYSQDWLRVEALLDLPTEEQIGPGRLPSFSYPSDHLSLVCDFSFTQQPGGTL
uniref:Nocturnin n=1 Tax=Tetraodon nigroviridis TaxID=99883 RepID=H3D476_TETNG